MLTVVGVPAPVVTLTARGVSNCKPVVPLVNVTDLTEVPAANVKFAAVVIAAATILALPLACGMMSQT